MLLLFVALLKTTVNHQRLLRRSELFTNSCLFVVCLLFVCLFENPLYVEIYMWLWYINKGVVFYLLLYHTNDDASCPVKMRNEREKRMEKKKEKERVDGGADTQLKRHHQQNRPKSLFDG